MKTRIHITPILWTALLVILTGSSAIAQQSAIHQRLLLHVPELNALSVPARLLPLDQSEAKEAAAKLLWTSNGSEKKITVAKQTPHPAGVRITVRDIDHHASEGRSVELTGETDIDLLYGLQRSAGACVIEFSLLSAFPASAPPVLILYTVTSS